MSDLQPAANEEGDVNMSEIPTETTNDNDNSIQNNQSKPNLIDVTLWLTCPSILTFIQKETPALNAHLSVKDKVDLKCFLADRLKAHGAPGINNFGQFLFHNTLSIAKRLFFPVLEAAYSRSEYSIVQKQQLAGELERLKAQENIDVLIQKRADAMVAKAGIGVIDGKPVYGPRCLEDHEDDEVPIAPMFYLSKGGLDGMREAMKE